MPKQTNNKTKRIPFLLICLCPLSECTGIHPGELDSGLIWAHPLPRELSFSNWGEGCHRTECEDHEKSHKSKRLQTVQTKINLKKIRWAMNLRCFQRAHPCNVHLHCFLGSKHMTGTLGPAKAVTPPQCQ